MEIPNAHHYIGSIKTDEMTELHREEEMEYFQAWGNVWKRERRIKMLVNLINPEGNVLDIGSRWGDVTNEIHHKNPNVIGMELVDTLVEMANKDYPHIKFLQANANKIPFPKESFDTVFIGETIEHMINPNVVIKEIHRVLKLKGELILSTPNMVSLRNRIKFLIGKQIDYDRGHINLMTRNQIVKLLEATGFEIVYLKADRINISHLKLPCFYTNFGDIFVLKAVKK